MKKIVADIETTGLADYHEITEISILDCETLEQITWMVKIKHPEKASKEALFITKKTIPELLSRGRYIEEIIPEVNEFINSISSNDPDDIVVIGWNISFDRSRLENAWKNAGFMFPANYYLCAMEMSKKYVRNVLNKKEKMSFKLSNIMKFASINVDGENHDSQTDTQSTYKMYMFLKSRGMTDSEFIRLSPTLMKDLSAPTGNLKKTGKKIDLEIKDLGDISKNYAPSASGWQGEEYRSDDADDDDDD